LGESRRESRTEDNEETLPIERIELEPEPTSSKKRRCSTRSSLPDSGPSMQSQPDIESSRVHRSAKRAKSQNSSHPTNHRRLASISSQPASHSSQIQSTMPTAPKKRRSVTGTPVIATQSRNFTPSSGLELFSTGNVFDTDGYQYS